MEIRDGEREGAIVLSRTPLLLEEHTFLYVHLRYEQSSPHRTESPYSQKTWYDVALISRQMTLSLSLNYQREVRMSCP
jgi:hypothetical protein